MEITPRDEVRVSEFGLLRCPSCHELAAEVLGRHNLVWGTKTLCPWCGHADTCHDYATRSFRSVPCSLCGTCTMTRSVPSRERLWWAECRDGEEVLTKDYETIVAISNIGLADQVWFSENQYYASMGLPLWGWRERDEG